MLFCPEEARRLAAEGRDYAVFVASTRAQEWADKPICWVEWRDTKRYDGRLAAWPHPCRQGPDRLRRFTYAWGRSARSIKVRPCGQDVRFDLRRLVVGFDAALEVGEIFLHVGRDVF
jgi:hypothetical protein